VAEVRALNNAQPSMPAVASILRRMQSLHDQGKGTNTTPVCSATRGDEL
jgi:hypothetical protein